jgi:hypothetical protein
LPSSSLPLQEGELSLGIAHIDYCTGHFFSGTVNVVGSSPVNASHVDGRRPGQGTDQVVIYMMTCSPISHPEDLKPLLKTAIHIVTSAEDAEDEYAALCFCLAPGELGIGSYLLLGLEPGSVPHMRLRNILLVQPDSTTGPHAWYPPPFLANPNQASRTCAKATTTPREVAAYLKTTYQPAL